MIADRGGSRRDATPGDLPWSASRRSSPVPAFETEEILERSGAAAPGDGRTAVPERAFRLQGHPLFRTLVIASFREIISGGAAGTALSEGGSMRRTSRLPFLTLRALAAVALIAGGFSGATMAARAAGPHAVPIAVARHLPLGTVVTIEGTATTPSDAFESSFFDKGFAIQDLTAGIFISLQDDLGVAPRRRVRVTGTLADSAGL